MEVSYSALSAQVRYISVLLFILPPAKWTWLFLREPTIYYLLVAKLAALLHRPFFQPGRGGVQGSSLHEKAWRAFNRKEEEGAWGAWATSISDKDPHEWLRKAFESWIYGLARGSWQDIVLCARAPAGSCIGVEELQKNVKFEAEILSVHARWA